MSVIGAQLAQSTLKSMYDTHVQSAQEQVRLGVAGEMDIENKSADLTDRLIASTAMAAYDAVDDVYSGLGILNKSLSVLAAGATGPIGSVLAQLATTTMFETHQVVAQNQCQVGVEYSRAIVDNTPDQTQKLLAQTGLAAYSATDNVYSGLGVLDSTLRDIPGALGKPAASVLAATGDRALHNKDVASAQDQCKIGAVFTQAVHDNTSDEHVKAAAQAALDAYRKSSGVYAGLTVLDTFLKSVH